MAFGFGFNKQKVLSVAEKFVQQGKLPNAIAEYEKILKADPKDLTVANTVGDLYARLGEVDKAINCFKSVGDAYGTQGFTVKAIAMYKKLTKLKPALDGVLRLAELYTQQGLFNDARAQYLQVAEEFLRAGELEQAVRIFQKTLEMDPENTAMRMKLAEVYIRLGKKTEAWEIFASAAESLRARGSLGPAQEILKRMLTLDPGNSNAMMLRGRIAFESGDVAGAIKNLGKVADLDSNPEGLRTLLQAYLQSGSLAEAGTLADKLVTVHNDTAAMVGYADALMAAGRFEDVLELYRKYSDRLLASDSAKVMESLHTIIGHVRESTSALEIVLELLQKAGENTHLTEVYELLAHAYVQAGNLEKARDYYLKLTQLEPQNQLHANNYQQVAAQLSGATPATRLITPEEGSVLVDELEATAPFIDQRYPDEVALALRSALTDAELFVSYNMPAKALGPLLSALPKAPRDLRLNQRLAALHTRASRFAEAAVCCRTLESIYHDAGHVDEATRYGELAGRYEERGSIGIAAPQESIPEPILVEMHVEPEEETLPAPVATAAPVPPVAPAPPVAKAAAAASPSAKASGLFWHAPAAPAKEPPAPEPAEFEVQPASEVAEAEIDLSEEWEGELAEDPASIPEPVAAAEPAPVPEEAIPAQEDETASRESAVAKAIEEIRFYLGHSMPEEAREAMVKLKQLKPDPATLAAVRAEVEAAIINAALAQDEMPAAEEAETVPVPPVKVAPPPQPKAGTIKGFSDLRPPAAKPPKVAPPPEPQVVEDAVEEVEADSDGVLGEFVSELEESLGDEFLSEAPIPAAQIEPTPAPRAVGNRVAPRVAPPQKPAAPSAMAAAAAASAPGSEPVAASPVLSVQPTPARSLVPGPPKAAPKFDSGPGVDLAGMFGELKHELEEDVATADEDPETHYNLGVAFREMGLLDEAIGELQKVCQSVERGRPFPLIMQTYTWLAQCFLDKGVPEAAIRWYERALKLSDIDQDTRIALHYELASAYETAADKPAALNHYMEVYGSNIDYRDVSERIKALKS
ncbi:MAG TPA: tetratricopeptide repeat protein [Terriglobales bacterium]|nr:tetratricopeptide repeat protein [Terriglobales bacterium]